jgi:two-component system cell cycle sensor histidine kinase/response regulator CckA
VLVVDDEATIRALLCAILSPLGYTVHAAASGAEALALLEDPCADVDLVLLDCQLPGEDGIGILRAVRALRPDLPVILQTGHPTGEVEARLGNLRVDGVIEKPFRVDSLCSALERAQAPSVFDRPPT